jgi:multisubunit Na+/H+ antiporter MnhG subunit
VVIAGVAEGGAVVVVVVVVVTFLDFERVTAKNTATEIMIMMMITITSVIHTHALSRSPIYDNTITCSTSTISFTELQLEFVHRLIELVPASSYS